MKKSSKKIIIYAIFCLILIAGIFITINCKKQDSTEPQENVEPASFKSFNVLLLGSDARPHEKVGNSDTIMVAHIDKERIALLSIPRDTRVEIPGKGKQKINSAVRYGGPELTAEIVSDLIGQPVSKYALVRWDGFIKIIDTLGGVTVDVPKDMYYNPDDGPEYTINLKKGRQKLNGRQALAFARFRHEALGDIDRSGQQLELMKALAEQSKKPGTLLKLPLLIPELYENIETNMDLKELIQLAKIGSNLKDIDVVTQTLPGYFLNLDGLSYWGVDPQQAQQVTRELFAYGKITTKVVLEPPAGYQQTTIAQTSEPQWAAPNPEEEEENEEEEPLSEDVDMFEPGYKPWDDENEHSEQPETPEPKEDEINDDPVPVAPQEPDPGPVSVYVN
jgi:LCP family protein required for cell wall assembly